MKTAQVTVSSKYQIVLPEEVRTALHIKPGQKIAIMRSGNSITLIPIRSIREMIGSMPKHEWDPAIFAIDRIGSYEHLSR